jgi:predicted esterase
MDTVTIPATIHGRYHVEGSGLSGTLFGFHGYGELADTAMEQMRLVPGLEGWRLVAVQALHPFYTRGGEIVASWMTRQDRELAISDNLAYVAAVVAAVRSLRPVVFAGFSQGAAMAARAAARLEPCDGAILLGGDIPPDVVENPPARLPPFLLGRGSEDEWYTAEKLKKDFNFLESRTRVDRIEFPGGHEWTAEFRSAAGRFLQSLREATNGAPGAL